MRRQAVGPGYRIVACVLTNEVIRRQLDRHPGAADQDGHGQEEQHDAPTEGDIRKVGHARLLHSRLRIEASRPQAIQSKAALRISGL